MLTGLLRPMAMRRAIGLLEQEIAAPRSVEAWLDFVTGFPERLAAPRRLRRKFSIAPIQVRSEIVRFLERVRALAPKRVVEVGTASGGSLFLLARVAAPDAILVSVDLPDAPGLPGYAAWREPLYRAFAAPGQTIHLVRGDSHAEATRDLVRARLGGEPADVVFVDGDHSYAGVVRDCDLYAPLVRPGGIVAFHDIVPDHRTRHGIDTVNDSGEVHRFWGEYKATRKATEIVDDPEQNGFGIGVVVAEPRP